MRLSAAAVVLLASGLVPVSSMAQGAALAPPKYDTPYGNNRGASAVEEVNGIKLYVETYGRGQPMLQIHGNGETIASMGHQIRFFSERYHVIAADSRGHGKRFTKPDTRDILSAMMAN